LPEHAVDIAFGAYIWNEEVVREAMVTLRQLGFQGRIIAGGPQVTYAGPVLEKLYPEADIFIRGYAEHALADVARTAGEPEEVAGVHLAGKEDQGMQAESDLCALPSPWLTGLLQPGPQGFIRMETQRGCPYRCAFCQHRDPGARPCRQLFSADRLDREIDLFCQMGVKEIAVLDPIFNVHPRAPEILHRFRQAGFRGRLALQCRAEMVTTTFLDALSGLDVCLEIGLQTIHETEANVIQRRNRLDKVNQVLDQLRTRRIGHEVSIIYGLPGQTLESFIQTVGWCLERRVPVLKAFPLLLLRGTSLESQREQWGFNVADGPLPVVTSSNTFGHKEWLAMSCIADVLRRTEGQHPRLRELLNAATRLLPTLDPPRTTQTRRAA